MKTPEKTPAVPSTESALAVSADLAVPGNDLAVVAEVTEEQVEEPTYVLAKRHRHAGVWYEAGHEFKASDWGLSEKQMGWLQGVGAVA